MIRQIFKNEPEDQSLKQRFHAEQVAKIAHAANFCYTKIQNDNGTPWEETPEEIRQSAIKGVLYVAQNDGLTNEELHQHWVEDKVSMGWTFAPGIVDREKKTHPCLVPWDQLDEAQKLKDDLFLNIVRTFLE